MATDTQKAKLVLVGGGVAGALLLIIGWFGLIHPKLGDAASLRSDAADVRDQNTVLEHKVADLKAASQNLSGLVAQLQAAADQLPSSDALSDLNVQLASYAAKDHVKITSVTAGDPQAFAGSTSSSPSASSSGGSTTGKPATKSVAGRLFTIGITLVTTGGGDDQVTFLHDVQHGARAALVTGSTVVPAGSATVHSFKASTTMTTTMQVFAQPLTPEAEAQLLKELGKNSS